MKNLMNALSVFALLSVMPIGLAAQSLQLADDSTPYHEHYRNQYHFYHTDSHSLTVDRTQVADFRLEKFERTCHAKVTVFSLATFAGDDQTGFEFFALDNDTHYQMNVWPMQSIWNQ